MNEEKNFAGEYSTITASLGLTGQTEMKEVMVRINQLINVEAALNQTKTDLTDAQKDLADAKTVIAGKEAAIQNLEKDIADLNASLKVYQDKEAEKKKNRIESMVEAAVKDGKIELESKAHWISMAEANFELVETTLDSIPKREQISIEIANDPANVQAANEAAKTVEEKMSEKVQAVVGNDFEFKKMEK